MFAIGCGSENGVSDQRRREREELKKNRQKAKKLCEDTCFLFYLTDGGVTHGLELKKVGGSIPNQGFLLGKERSNLPSCRHSSQGSFDDLVQTTTTFHGTSTTSQSSVFLYQIVTCLLLCSFGGFIHDFSLRLREREKPSRRRKEWRNF